MKCSTIVAILWLLEIPVISQDKYIADSLQLLLDKEGLKDDSSAFALVHMLGYYHPKPVKALVYSFEAFNIATRMNNDLLRARALESIGVNNRIIGNKIKAYKATFDALAIYDSLKLPRRQAVLQIQLGENLTEDGEYVKAIEHFKKGIRIYDSLNRSIQLNMAYQVAVACNNLGEAFRLNGQYLEAEQSFKKSLQINERIDDDVIQAYSLGNLGMVYKSCNKHDEAATQLKEAVKILMDYEDYSATSVYLSEVAEINLSRGELEEGERQLLESLDLAKAYNLKSQIRDISAKLTKHFIRQKQFEDALIYQQLFQVYQDSLVNAENIRQVEQIKAGYEIDKKNAEIKQLALQKNLTASQLKQKETELMYNMVVSIIFLLLIMIVYYGYRTKKKASILLQQKNRIINRQIRDKELMHREMHHRIKNNLQLIGSIMGLHSRSTNDRSLSDAMMAGKSRVEAMSLIHQNLYSDQYSTVVNAKAYLTKLIDNLKATYREQIGTIESKILDMNLKADECIPVGLIINEAVCNAVKYKGPVPISMGINFVIFEGGYLLSVSDNGPGFNDKSQETGFGSRLIATLAKQLRAKLQVKSNSNGTTIQLFISELTTDGHDIKTMEREKVIIE